MVIINIELGEISFKLKAKICWNKIFKDSNFESKNREK